MSQEEAWGAVSSIVFELPASEQDYYAWLTEAAHNMTVPFRRHYRTQKAKNGRGFWLVEDMWEYGNGRGPLVWVEVAPGSTDELTEFSLTPCSDAISLPTLRGLAQKSIAELCGEAPEGPNDSAPFAEVAEAGDCAPAGADDALLAAIPSVADRDFVRRWNGGENSESLRRAFGLKDAHAVGNKAYALRKIFPDLVKTRRNQGNWEGNDEE